MQADLADVGRSTLRKAAWRLLPLIALGYGIAYVDRSNISFAALQMNQELHFSAAVYGLGAGLFFLSYSLFEVPSNLLLMRIGARRWLARILLTWGALAMGMALVRTPLQFYIMRFLLGLAEAGFFPGVLYYLSQWFPRSQRAKMVSAFYVAVPLSSAAMGAAAGAILGLQGRMALSGWQWLFLIEGAPAVLLGIAYVFLLPDSAEKARWLSPDEKAWITGWMAAEAEAHGPDHPGGLLRALANPTVLKFGAVNFLILGSSYAFTLSVPTILQGIGFSPGRIGAFAALAGLLAAPVMIIQGWRSDRLQERRLHLAVALVLVGVTYAAAGLARSPVLAVGGYVLYWPAVMAVSVVFWAWPTERLRPAAAAVGIAAINCIGQFGSFVCTWAWGVAHDLTGGYGAGFLALPVMCLIAAWIALDLGRREAPAKAAAAAPSLIR